MTAFLFALALENIFSSPSPSSLLSARSIT